MGIYLNPTNMNFSKCINSEIYIDKSELIAYTNKRLNTQQAYICVSRPRRFGKSMAADMLSAYYSSGCDSKELFKGLKIIEHSCFEKHLNQYNVIKINMQEFLSRTKTIEDMITLLEKQILWELTGDFSDVRFFDASELQSSIGDVFAQKHTPFIFIIDEWDCIFREYKNNKDSQEKYLDFLRNLLKDKPYVSLAYMTGILPIKKYGTHSALNMFSEFSMTDAGSVSEFVGFTESEVKILCKKYDMPFEETKSWYDGYYLKEIGSVYNPRSVVESMLRKKFNNYWNQTETYEALRMYILMNFEGLRDTIIRLISGDRKKANLNKFQNDMTTLKSADDVLALLVHLGYLAYDFDSKEVFIPNKEISNEFINSVEDSDWDEIVNALKLSDNLLHDTWQMNSEKVAEAIQKAHLETSHIQYNDENALSYTISLAYYSARQYYTMIRELPTGNGYADIAFIPRKKFADKPALIIELKWNKSAEGAIAQIKNKQYFESLKEYKGNLLLVGINYDKKTREHTCEIEMMEISNQ